MYATKNFILLLLKEAFASFQIPMTHLKSKSIYISAGCNRSPNVADCHSTGLIAFGAGRNIALWNTEVSYSQTVNCMAPF